MATQNIQKSKQPFVLYSSLAIVVVLGITNYWLFEQNRQQNMKYLELTVRNKMDRAEDLSFHYIMEYETDLLRDFQQSLEKEPDIVYAIIDNHLTNTTFGQQKYQPEATVKEYSRNVQIEEKGEIYGVVRLGIDVTQFKNAIIRSFYYYFASFGISLIFIVGFLSRFFNRDVAPKLARFEAALNSSTESIYLVDRKSMLIVDANQAAWRSLGYNRDELLQMALYEIATDIDLDELEDKLNSMQSGKCAEIILDAVQRSKNGRLFSVEIYINPFYNNHQEFFIAVARDVTKRKEYELQLIQEKERAQKANSAKSEFLSHMSHELRTPLNSVLGFSQLLQQDTGLSEMHAEMIEEITNAGEHLLGLINEVLDLAKIEAGALTVSPQAVDLQDIILSCLNLLQPQAEKNSVALHYDFDTANHTVYADPTRLREVLVNLVSNAIKYNKKDGEVRIMAEALGANFVRISVSDTGCGIREEHKDKIFMPFERNGAENSGIDGVGIGLSLSKKLIELMQGKIAFDSIPGEGCTFWIDIPLKHADSYPERNTGVGEKCGLAAVVGRD